MMSYGNLVRELPAEVQFPMMNILDQLRGELSDTVTKTDFSRLEGVVSVLGDKTLELAEAQKRTELRVEELAGAQKELAEAQKRTELRVEELAEAQKRTELRVEELAEAQKRTELRVEELAEAQKRTELRVEELAQVVEELAEAQKKTEETLGRVVKRQDRMGSQLGGLANSFGYFLENEAIRFLPGILGRERGIDIRVMDRRFVVYADGRDDEINIYGEGLEDGREVYIIGESKSQFGKKDADRFRKLLLRVSDHLKSEVCPLAVTHSVHPDTEAYAKEMIPGLRFYMSYELKE
ncbi:MAG: hypothetical protein B6245_07075 [Desulfobacteraceae bacterium 4572_88]|nr:MAG: hypothetical protein B6245_07075 [Desulfobacteraceae bacterium 4572_88]